jgi:hypothetical protein
VVRIAFVLVAGMVTAAMVVHYTRAPNGEWDAWAIWNQKARFLLRGGHDWTQALRIPWVEPQPSLAGVVGCGAALGVCG